jgi:predicted Fe-Mo cluster-binding NifX family protein
MKIAISATGPDINAPFDPRFGRGANFIFVDAETGEWEGHPNAAVNAGGGAGIQAAQFVVEHGAQAVVSGNFGPNAFATLKAAGLRMFIAREGTVQELVDRFKAGELQEVDVATRVVGLRHSGRRGRRSGQ